MGGGGSNTVYVYTHYLDKQFVGTIVKLNSKGDRLLVTAPQMSPFDPVNSTLIPTGQNIGTAYIIDHDPDNDSWSTTSYISSKYILGDNQQYLGNCATLSGNGNVFAIGSPTAGGHAGFLNVYNYNTKIDIKSVCAFSTNGKLVLGGGNGTNNVFIYSPDGGVTWNNCNNDFQGGFYNGKVTSIYNPLVVGLQDIIECPNDNGLDLQQTFGGQFWNPNHPIIGILNENFSKFVTPDSVALNSSATIMAIGSAKYNHTNYLNPGRFGIVYMYSKDYKSNNWNLIYTVKSLGTYDIPDNTINKCSFGYIVKLNSTGSIMVTSAPSWSITRVQENVGAIYIFAANSTLTQWSHLQTIENPYYTPAVFNNTSYDFYVAGITATNWFAQLLLNPNNYPKDANFGTYATFGISIAINNTGSVIVVGGLYTKDNTGIVYTFNSNEAINKWAMNQAIDATVGLPYTIGTQSATSGGREYTPVSLGYKDYYFGNSLALNNEGDILAVSSRNEIRIFYFLNNDWVYKGDPTNGSWGPNESKGRRSNFFIYSMSMNAAGTILAVGGKFPNVGDFNGSTFGSAIYIYDISNNRTGGSIQQLQNIYNPTSKTFGTKVSLNSQGNVLVASNTTLTNTMTSNNSLIAQSDSFNVICSSDRWLTILSNQPYAGRIDSNFGSCVVMSNGGQTIAVGAPGDGQYGRVHTYDFNNTLHALQGRRCNTIANNMNIWVAGGGDPSFNNNVNPFSHSYDGMNWIAAESPGLKNFITCNVIKWNGGKFVAGGYGPNPLAYSYDGKYWFNSTFSVMSTIYDLTWNGTYWIAVGQSNVIGTIAYSSDGITWKLVNTELPFNIISIASRSVISVNGNTAGGGGSDQISLSTLYESFGYKQTWKDLSALKASGVAYINETGKPIVVNIYFNNPQPVDTSNENSTAGASASNVNIFVGGMIMGSYGYIETTATFIVPPTVSYAFQGKFISWYEFS